MIPGMVKFAEIRNAGHRIESKETGYGGKTAFSQGTAHGKGQKLLSAQAHRQSYTGLGKS